jgi:D-alanine-D-alanine ligase
MKIALLFNQKPGSDGATAAADTYCEWDSPATIAAVADALRVCHDVVEIDCHPQRLPQVITQLQAARPDLCFNMAEGVGCVSREAQIPALLDLLGLRYTASDPLTLALALDKARTKEVLTYHGVPTPAFHVLRTPAELATASTTGLPLPAIVKPLHEGSSKGIFERSLVTTPAELAGQVQEVWREYAQPALVEEFLPGREFTVALLGNAPELEVLPLIEIDFSALPPGAKPVYGYEAKWIWDTPSRRREVLRCPAHVSPELQAAIAAVSRRAFVALRCRDWARIDVRLDAAGRPQVLELNPLPGILPDPDDHSAFPMAARQQGLTYPQLIRRVVDIACRRLQGMESTASPLP